MNTFFEPTHDDMNHLAAKAPRSKNEGVVGDVLMLDQYVVIADYKQVRMSSCNHFVRFLLSCRNSRVLPDIIASAVFFQHVSFHY